MPEPLSQDAQQEYEQLRQDLLALSRGMAEVTETAYSPDGLVAATVGPQGELKDLQLDPRIYRTTDSAALAETIVATIRDAAAAANARTYELTSELVPESLRRDMVADLGIDIGEYLGGNSEADADIAPYPSAEGGRDR